MLMLACLSGCAWLTTANDTESFENLQLATPINPPRRVVQQITADWLNHQETFLCVLELNSQHIAVAGLTKDGMSLFNISFNGKEMMIDKNPLLPKHVSPEQIIKDLQLVFWPPAELNKILSTPWRLETEKSHRYLYFNDDLMATVDYIQPDAIWPKSAILTNQSYHYRLHINTISYEALPE